MAKRSPNPIDKHVGLRIRARRLMLGMSQQTLAKALSLTFQQVQKYEKGSNRVGASRLHQTAAALQVPVAFFFEGLPHAGAARGRAELAGSPALIGEFFALPYASELARHYVAISHTLDRRVVADVARTIAERSAPAKARAA